MFPLFMDPRHLMSLLDMLQHGEFNALGKVISSSYGVKLCEVIGFDFGLPTRRCQSSLQLGLFCQAEQFN